MKACYVRKLKTLSDIRNTRRFQNKWRSYTPECNEVNPSWFVTSFTRDGVKKRCRGNPLCHCGAKFQRRNFNFSILLTPFCRDIPAPRGNCFPDLVTSLDGATTQRRAFVVVSFLHVSECELRITPWSLCIRTVLCKTRLAHTKAK